MKKRILYVAHNHLSASPGGVEVYVQELYESLKTSTDYEPFLLARTGGWASTEPPHLGTRFLAANTDPHQYLFFTSAGDYNSLMLTNRRRHAYSRDLREFLHTYEPDVVHFHHTLFLGIEAITTVRSSLPAVPIVFTLHDYLPICHNHGQMVRVGSDELCSAPSAQCCHECFPDISPQTFFLRSRLIQSHLSRVDRFIAPSRFLLERFVQWGVPRDRLVFEEHGRTAAEAAAEAPTRPTPNRFAFFGRINHFKGLTVLLEAVRRLQDHAGSSPARNTSPALQVHIHGSGLESCPPDYQQRVHELLEKTRGCVTWHGHYTAAQLPRLMSNIDWVVVPSIWWENAPLVIQEAFAHRRPVICSDIGGMAEKVVAETNGLHFRVNDPESLAAVLARASADGELWRRLRENIPPIRTMSAHVGFLSKLYDDLLQRNHEIALDARLCRGGRPPHEGHHHGDRLVPERQS